MSQRSFFSRIFGADEDETRNYSGEEVGARRSRRRQGPEEEQPRGFTVERAAGIINDLPPDVPRTSALRIVSGTLAAAGIEIRDLERSTRTRTAKLDSEIELARSRQRDLGEKTEEAVRSLEEQIRKAREAHDIGIAKEEEEISRVLAGLEDIKRVRVFFGFPETEETTGPAEEDADGDETRVLNPFDADETRVMRPGPHTDPGER